MCDTTRGGCVEVVCGDGVTDAAFEVCDDGDAIDNGEGGCVADCSAIQVCGNGALEGTETCDDGDTLDNGEGSCIADCSAVRVCGNGVIDGREECDDGDANSDTTSNACRSDCFLPRCGDAVRDSGESCDDGNLLAGDGCTDICSVQSGWRCQGVAPAQCVLLGMVIVPSGTFIMGTPAEDPGYLPGEAQHSVTLTRDFSIQSLEVGAAQFRGVVGWSAPFGSICQRDCPQAAVSWFDAVHYVNMLSARHGFAPCYILTDVTCFDGTAVGDAAAACMNDTRFGIDSATVELNGVASVYACEGYRLATEAEWEYAARAGTTAGTYNGDLSADLLLCEQPNPVLDPIGWFCGNSSDSQPRGSLQPNDWQLYDMLGNLWEWCHDQILIVDRTEPVTDPEGDAAGAGRCVRGGSWEAWALFLRAGSRYEAAPGLRALNIGFRVVRTLPP